LCIATVTKGATTISDFSLGSVEAFGSLAQF
jgi:hypothetical protein